MHAEDGQNVTFLFRQTFSEKYRHVKYITNKAENTLTDILKQDKNGAEWTILTYWPGNSE